MSPLLYAGFLLTGIAAGVAGGFFGIGGAILLIPALTLFFQLDQRSAQGTSLAALLLPIGFLGFWQYWKNPAVHINLLAAGLIALGFFIGGYFGGKAANTAVNLDLLRRCFAVFLACVSVYMFFKR